MTETEVVYRCAKISKGNKETVRTRVPVRVEPFGIAQDRPCRRIDRAGKSQTLSFPLPWREGMKGRG